MTWRLKIQHVSGYSYQSPVGSSYNEARITPLSTLTQTTIDSRVDIEPEARPYRYWDYWGTLVHAFDIQVAHSKLVVTGRSVVETNPPSPPESLAAWSDLEERRDSLWEYLASTEYVPSTPEFSQLAEQFRVATSPARAASELADWVGSTMGYAPGTTQVSTSALEALSAKQGVCQDFAHVFIGVARALGIPARYVSGYLHPSQDPEMGETVKGQSHAWVEAWVGAWVAFDPTNGETPGLRHVNVARGRDYRDVSPLRGIYSGGSAHALEVEVSLTRVG